MEKPACANCQFFRKSASNNTAYGDCVRYPEPITHLETFWCGEYRAQTVSIKEPAKRKA